MRRRDKGTWTIKNIAEIENWLEAHMYKPPARAADLQDLDSDTLFVIPGSKFVHPDHGEGFAFTSLKVSHFRVLHPIPCKLTVFHFAVTAQCPCSLAWCDQASS